jgi:hypothetical protein
MHIVSTTNKKIYFAPRSFGVAKQIDDINAYISRVETDSGYLEAEACVLEDVRELNDIEVSVSITDEETNTSTTSTIDARREGNFFFITPEYTFKEGRYYTIRITDSNEIYRGKVYCTNQTDLEKFSVNSGEFTYYEDTDNDNQYIYR